MRHVIIGGSIAGISAARSIRVLDAGADITMVSGEMAKPYYRPLIPSVIEKGTVDIGFVDDPIETYSIRNVYDTANGVDPGAQQVLLASGGRLPYDRLLIATGCRAVIPPIAGLQGPGVYALRTLDDALSIQAAARGKKHAVVLGGGFVGIKSAIALKRLGLKVTLLEKLDRILYEKLDRRGSAMITDLIKRENIDIITNQSDYEIVRQGGALRSLRLASGRIIDTDLIVVAVGTKPNVEPFRNAGIKINKGILIGETLETSIPGVYAAGDVVEYRDMVSKTAAVSAFWTNAEEMGRLAGKNMAGSSVRYTGFLSLMNTAEIMNVAVTAIGLIDPQNNGYEVCLQGDGDSYRKLVFRKDVMVGALFIGSEERMGVYTYLIRNQIPMGKLKGLALQGKLGYIDFVKTAAIPTA